MGSTIIPTMRYRDAAKMIDWLVDAFGFERHLVVDDGGGGIAHAQLTLGDSMIMLGSHRDDTFGRLQSTAAKLGGTTQSPYIVVAGAEVVIDIKDEDYGGRGFSCRDPEGQLWNIGTYDPWNTNV